MSEIEMHNTRSANTVAALTSAEGERRSWPKTVFVFTTKKGGAGKTETAECIEALSTLSGKRCMLVDVDDGNRGIGRRVGLENVTKVHWESSVQAAPQWVRAHAAAADTMIFDLGAGIDSSDLPIMAFLATVWRLLADGGSRIIMCAVLGTNAPTTRFVEKLSQRFASLGEVIVICNNQDGSGEYANELASLTQPKVKLSQLPAGVQAVRLTRLEPLSRVIRNPGPDHKIASAIMARRLLALAGQDYLVDLVSSKARDELNSIASRSPAHFQYIIATKAEASDIVLEQNARVWRADRAFHKVDLMSAALLPAARELRTEHDSFFNILKEAKAKV